MKIKFLGAAKVVTGSNHLIITDKYKLLIDCGLFQGSEELERLNYNNFEFDPKEIDFLLLTHAHIDHSGRIPKLVNEGFNGKIICTKATKELCDIMLLDSGHIQESDAKWENKKRERSGKPFIKPLYTGDDALKSLKHFDSVLYDQKIELNEDITVRFKDAGHILGSSIIELWIKEKEKEVKIVFSGDIGVKNRPILRDPEYIDEADYLVVESTYGNRLHNNDHERAKELIDIINDTVANNGTVIIPSFAVSRTQELIYELNKYYEYNNKLEEFMKIPIYIDSPMAVNATKVYRQNSYCFDEEAKKLLMEGDDPFNFPNLHYVRSQDESMRLNTVNFPKVIISASGMCNAGRIRHHLKHNIWKGENSIVFVGYQADGTLGRNIKDGKEIVNILGEDVVVNAKVYSIEGFSGHADKDGLLDWIGGFNKKPKKVFVVHGEDKSSTEFANIISEKYNLSTFVPDMNDEFEIYSHDLDNKSTENLSIDEMKNNISKELKVVFDELESLKDKKELFFDDKLLSKDYDKIKNRLLELQQKLLDFNIIIGK